MNPVTLGVGDFKPQDVFGVIFNRIPSRRPNRKCETEAGLFDIGYCGRDMKKLFINIGNGDRVIDLKLIRLPINGCRRQ